MRPRTLAWGAALLVLMAAWRWHSRRQTGPAAPAVSAPQAPAYSYNAEGRRDPFVSLMRGEPT